MGGRGKTFKSKQSIKTAKNKALELYRTFVEGGSYDIHTGSEADKKILDTLFEPAPEDIVTYKGLPVTEEEFEDLENVISSYASTSWDRNVAWDYMGYAYDTEGDIPVFARVHIAKGTPIADARKLLGESGMKAYEKEITIGRNVKYEYKNLKFVDDSLGGHYFVDIYVTKK